MKVVLKSANGNEIYNEFSHGCSACISSCNKESEKVTCPIFKDKRRIGIATNDLGSAFCCTTNKDILRSSKSFKREQKSKLYGINEVELSKTKLNLEAKKLIHNLTKTNGHNIQELYALVPQEILTQNLHEQLDTIRNIIVGDPEEAAKTFLRIAKNNASMKTEFSVFAKLSGDDPALHKKRHPVRKVALNIFHIFFQKFSELNVFVAFDENEDYLIFDYESIHVTLYHLIDNAAKYVLPGSKFHVHFKKSDDHFSIVLDMISLRIEEDEKSKLLEEGYSGKIARKLKKSGSGIGLGLVAKILALNDAELIIHNNVKPFKSVEKNGVWYDNNLFEIRLNNYAQQKVNAMR